MADFKSKFPGVATVTIGLHTTPLGSDSNLLAGRESTVINNATSLDLDHLVSGKITTGTTPTASRQIEIWAYAVRDMGGTPVYPAGVTGSDAALSIASTNVKNAALRLLEVIETDSTSDRSYFFGPLSIADAFGRMPSGWGLFVVHNTAVALNSTAGNHVIAYERIQNQSV